MVDAVGVAVEDRVLLDVEQSLRHRQGAARAARAATPSAIAAVDWVDAVAGRRDQVPQQRCRPARQ